MRFFLQQNRRAPALRSGSRGLALSGGKAGPGEPFPPGAGRRFRHAGSAAPSCSGLEEHTVGLYPEF